ncbi:hypothetical protein [Burkholderia pseudomallei]|uniref:hypothetical protein n=1 Tax=Burkholderia pseudomallei TaxID=28450 RepID=UPI001EFA5939|nr:hypothetical protein [Burkholderia pseudomallei]
MHVVGLAVGDAQARRDFRVAARELAHRAPQQRDLAFVVGKEVVHRQGAVRVRPNGAIARRALIRASPARRERRRAKIGGCGGSGVPGVRPASGSARVVPRVRDAGIAAEIIGRAPIPGETGVRRIEAARRGERETVAVVIEMRTEYPHHCRLAVESACVSRASLGQMGRAAPMNILHDHATA